MNISVADLRRLGFRIQGSEAMKVASPSLAMQSRTVKVFLDCKIKSEANAGGKLRDSLRRKAEQKAAVIDALGAKIAGRGQPKSVTFVLLTSQFQDDDNLQRSFKSIRDQIAELLKMPDDSAKIWHYKQALLRPWEPRGAWVHLQWKKTK